jgi:hypothetical protein
MQALNNKIDSAPGLIPEVHFFFQQQQVHGFAISDLDVWKMYSLTRLN